MSKRVLLIFTLIFICLISLSTVCALDMDSTNLNNNSNTDFATGLNANLDKHLDSNLNNNIDDYSSELGLNTKNFKALSSNSSIGGGANSSVNLSSNQNSQDNSIIIDDTNYDTYFDNQGFLTSDIEANSLIYFGNLSNRYIRIDIPVNISSLSDTTLFNSTIEVLMDGSYSNLTNLNFYTNATSENSNYLAPIYLNQASDIIVENNLIHIEYYDGSNYNLAGIYAFGTSNNNIIRNNRISIYSKSEESQSKYYIYGIDFSTYMAGSFATGNARNNIISSNTIDIVSNYYANAITLSCAVDTLVDSNHLDLRSDSFIYGIVAEYFDSGYEMEQSHNFTFTGNTIEARSSMAYPIQFFNVYDVAITENSIKTASNGTYGISGYDCHDYDIKDNRIMVSGNDISNVGTNFDAIGTGHAGIYFTKDSYNISIHDNNVLSNYSLGGDYAVKFDASSTENIDVYNNNLSSNNANYLGNDAVSGNVNIYDNNPYIESEDGSSNLITNFTIVDIYVDLNGNDDKGNGSYEKPFKSINKALAYLKTLNDNLNANPDPDSNVLTKIKGIIHIGEGEYSGYPNNVRLTIADMAVDIVGVYNRTTIDGKASHWFFEVSDTGSLSLKNINFTNGTYRKNNVGLIYNKGNLSLENCSFINSKIPVSSAVILNDGRLDLKNSFMEISNNAYLIYNNGILKSTNNNLTSSNRSKIIFNNGLVDDVYLNLIVDSLNEDERILNFNSTKVNLTAFVHDDNGNPITGGYVTFFVEGREILVNASLDEGLASLHTYTSLHGIVKVSGFYTKAYTNLNVNIGKINNALFADSIVLYVKLPNPNESNELDNDSEQSGDSGNDPSGSGSSNAGAENQNNNQDFEEDGSFEHPFSSINAAFREVGTSIEPITIYLLDSNFNEDIDSSLIVGNNLITLQGNENKTSIQKYWTLNTSTPICLKDLVFDGKFILKIGTDLTVDNCLFTHSPQASIYSVNGSLTVLNSNFTQNNIKDPHHTYYSLANENAYIPDYVLLFLDGFFYAGNYYDRGGAIHNLYSNLTVLNCNFIENEAFYGGAIYNSHSDLHISNSDFIKNLVYDGLSQDFGSQSYGGAIYQYFGNEVVVTDCLFINNTADGLGGAFFSSGVYPNNDIGGSYFMLADSYYVYRHNDSGYFNNKEELIENITSPQDIYFINCTFDSNLAPNGGGAIYILNNSMTSYISCNFLNNMAFTYNITQLFQGRYHHSGGNWYYQDELENILSVIYSPANYGGAIRDKNLKIIDSTFAANTLESGGSIIMPTILTYTTERNSLSKYTAGTTVANSVSGSESVYVADSSLLTAADSEYLGITGWSGNSTGSSIRRLIPNNSGSGNGNSNNDGSSNGDGSGSGTGTGSGNGIGSGGLNWGDILNALGGDVNNIAINGDGSGLAEYLNNLINGKSNSNSSANSNGTGSSNSSSSNGNGSSNSGGTSPTNSSSANSTNSSSVNPTNSSSSSNSTANATNSSSGNSTSGNVNPTNSSSSNTNPVNQTNSSSNNPDSNSDLENITDNSSDNPEVPMNNTNNSTAENQDSNTNSTENNEENQDSNTDPTENNEEEEDSETESDGVIDIDDDDSHSDVGESADSLSGETSENSESSEDSESSESKPSPADSSSSNISPADSSSSSPGSSSSRPASSSANAYKLTKDEVEYIVVEKDVDIYNLAIILILFLSLILLGYYKKSREDDEK